MKRIVLLLLAASCSHAPPSAPAPQPCPAPPQEEYIRMFDTGTYEQGPACPEQFFYCMSIPEAKALARNLRKLRDYKSSAYEWCKPPELIPLGPPSH